MYGMHDFIDFIKSDPANLNVFLITIGAAMAFVYMLIRLIVTTRLKAKAMETMERAYVSEPTWTTETETRTYAPDTIKELQREAEMALDVVEAAETMILHAQRVKDSNLESKWIAKAKHYESIRRAAVAKIRDVEDPM